MTKGEKTKTVITRDFRDKIGLCRQFYTQKAESCRPIGEKTHSQRVFHLSFPSRAAATCSQCYSTTDKGDKQAEQAEKITPRTEFSLPTGLNMPQKHTVPFSLRGAPRYHYFSAFRNRQDGRIRLMVSRTAGTNRFFPKAREQ